jgi:hypothetical protein
MVEIYIYIERERLTDGSFVFNVRLGDVVLHAYDEAAAKALAMTIAEAVNEYTTDMCGDAKETNK